jgi:hypothetical protein
MNNNPSPEAKFLIQGYVSGLNTSINKVNICIDAFVTHPEKIGYYEMESMLLMLLQSLQGTRDGIKDILDILDSKQN